MSLRAIFGYAGTALASLGVFAAFAFTGIQNQAMAGPASYAADQLQAAPAYTAAPAVKAVKQKPVATVSPVIVAGPVAATSLYEVRSGDTLSAIAKAQYGKATDWPVIYYANRKQINNPDQIAIGQTFRIPALPAHIPAAPRTTPAVSTDTTAAVAVSSSTQQTNYLTNDGGYSVTSAFQACVIRAESGGNPQIWNPSGHWGLYQFSYGTWVAHGGDPSLFGKADGAYQTQIFWNTVAQDGTSDWAPYDGC